MTISQATQGALDAALLAYAAKMHRGAEPFATTEECRTDILRLLRVGRRCNGRYIPGVLQSYVTKVTICLLPRHAREVPCRFLADDGSLFEFKDGRCQPVKDERHVESVESTAGDVVGDQDRG